MAAAGEPRPKRSRWKRHTAIVTLALVVALAAFWFSRRAETPPRGSGQYMTAVRYHEYGSADVLKVERVERVLPGEGQVVVRVVAAAANPLDWHYLRGTPYLMRLETGLRRPKSDRVGVDLAGTVVEVGAGVTRFKVGDEVFGTGQGSFAEYTLASQEKIVPKPAALSFEQAAAVPVAALTALQGLRDEGRLRTGKRVLINGASGGVGTFAVQIAKAMGAHVTGVCSSRNVDLVRALGADQVIDYTREDFARRPERYDVILDNVGNRSRTEYRSVMTPTGIYVRVGGGGPNDGRWFGPMLSVVGDAVYSPFVSQNFGMLLAEIRRDDLLFVRRLIEEGRVRPVIDRTYPLAEAAEAIRYLETGRARGKVIIRVAPAPQVG